MADKLPAGLSPNKSKWLLGRLEKLAQEGKPLFFGSESSAREFAYFLDDVYPEYIFVTLYVTYAIFLNDESLIRYYDYLVANRPFLLYNIEYFQEDFDIISYVRHHLKSETQ